MDEPNPPPFPPPLPPVTELAQDLGCARCGYNLRGLQTNQSCPECGTPIERSLQGNLLRFADPAWLNKLRLGVALKLWNLLVALVVGLGAGLAAAFGLGVVQIALGLVASLLGIWAVWLITAPEPNIAAEEDPMSLRRVIRACAVIGLLGGQAQQVFVSGTPNMAPGAMPGPVLLALLGAMIMVGICAMFGEFVYLRRFARRVPDQTLADNTTVVMWGLCTTIGAGTVMGAVAALVLMPLAGTAAAGAPTPPAPPMWAMAVFGITGCVGGIGLLVFGIWNIVLLFQYHARFRSTLAEAR